MSSAAPVRPGLFVQRFTPASPVRSESYWFDTSPASGGGALKVWTGSQWELMLTPSGMAISGGGIATWPNSANDPPAAPGHGDIWLVSGGHYIKRYDLNSGWTGYGTVRLMQEPGSGSAFTWVNQGSASINTDNGGIFIKELGPTSRNLRLLTIPIPVAPWTFTSAWMPLVRPQDGASGFGIGWYQSNSKSAIAFYVRAATSALGGTNNFQLLAAKFSTWSGGPSAYETRGFNFTTPVYLRITQNASGRSGLISTDGYHFSQVHSSAANDFLPAPDQVFVGLITDNDPIGATLISWEQGSS